MAKELITAITLEIENIDQLFVVYAELLQQTAEKNPSLIEVTALASVLHSFYNGLENIFLTFAKQIDHDIPTGNKWHNDLLMQMTRKNATRNHILVDETAQNLATYLAFRHFYRHSYSFLLKWEKIEDLVLVLPTIWQQTKGEIQSFIRDLSI